MKRNLILLFPALLALSSILDVVAESERGNVVEESLKNLISQAKLMAAATTKKDFGKVADLTHSIVIELNGGREEMISKTLNLMKQMSESGYYVEGVKIGSPNYTVQEGKETFATISQEVVMRFPAGKIVSKSFLLAISENKGKTWKFVDGQGLSNEGLKKRLSIPPKLEIPEVEKPRVIRKKLESTPSQPLKD